MNRERVGARVGSAGAAAAPHAIERLAARRGEAKGEIMTSVGGAVAGSAQRSSEGVMAAVAGSRVTQASLAGGLPMRLMAVERVLLEELFKRVVLHDDDLFGGKAKNVLSNLNSKFRLWLGANAVVVRTLHGKVATGGSFCWLALNPEFFDARERKPRAGKHFKLRDVFMPTQVKVIEFIAANGLCTLKAIVGKTGVNAGTVQEHLGDEINKWCRKCGFPRAIEAVERFPRLYRVRADFAKKFGLALERKVSLQAFLKTQRKVLEFLAENPNSTIEEIAGHFKWGESKVRQVIERINAKAKTFGLKATVRYNKDRRFYYSLSPEFAEAIGLERKEKFELSMYFTSREQWLVEFVAGHPNATIKQVSEARGRDESTTTELVVCIEKKCARHGLPEPFRKIGKSGRRHSLAKQFAKKFAIETVEAEARSILTETQKPVYDFFNENPGASIGEAAAGLGMKWNYVALHFRNINKVLKAEGFPELERKREGGKYASFEQVAREFARRRKANGKWPDTLEMRALGENALMKAMARYGGIREVRKRVWGDLNAGEQRRLMTQEWRELTGNGLFEKFGSGANVVKNTASKALQNGADRQRIEKIIGRSSNVAKTLKALEAA